MSIVEFPHHEISLLVGGKQIKGWTAYEVEVSMLEAADHFNLTIPFDRDVWNLCKPDTLAQVLIDDVAIITGYIAERLLPEDEEVIQIIGVDKVGRGLVKNAAPGVKFAGLGIKEIATAVVKGWFDSVSLSNVRNRTVLRGKRGKKARHKRHGGSGGSGISRTGAKASDQALVLNTHVGTQIQPGMTRWQVIELLCEQAGYLAWSSGDGTELIIGEPDYEQEIQFRFFKPAAGSARSAESTVLGMGRHDSIQDRYSRIIVVGSGAGTDVNFGATVASRFGDAKNNELTPDGDGLDFIAPKVLIQPRSVQSIEEADELAQREMDRRDALGHIIPVRAPGHGQVIAGLFPTLFAPDLLASVEDERTGDQGTYIIVSCTYRSDRPGGEETVMSLMKSGSRLMS